MGAPPRIGWCSSSMTGSHCWTSAGPAEVFAEANRFGADYQIVLASPTGTDVTSSVGIRIAVDAAASQSAPDTFLVAGCRPLPAKPCRP